MLKPPPPKKELNKFYNVKIETKCSLSKGELHNNDKNLFLLMHYDL